ncbi:cysteine/Histidine-rich C1 domain family protein [Striga asiatica]|uniref:Cysteine/Histidine-rich C1 domain family protein n=1 Tax=Striga asiatica TaxID=4170 RepID=A0A5A7PUD8_STRAF|nr:cysteine/Histidine-rich C1 domain family protein [Striga asiatica]
MAVTGRRLPAILTEGGPPSDAAGVHQCDGEANRREANHLETPSLAPPIAAYHHHSAARLKLRPSPHFRNLDRTSPAPPSAHPSPFKISTTFSQPHLRPSPSIRRISRTFAVQRFSRTSAHLCPFQSTAATSARSECHNRRRSTAIEMNNS